VRKTILSVAIIIWVAVGISAATIFIYAALNLPVPDRISGLPGYHIVSGGGRVYLINEESFPVEGVLDIHINGTYHSIIVKLHDGRDLNVRQYDYENADGFDMRADGDEIVITAAQWRFSLSSFFGFGINPRLEIDMPNAYMGNISFISSSGSITIENDAAWNDTILNTRSGNIRVNGYLTGDSIKIESSSGNLTVAGFLTGGAVDVSSSTGNVRLNGDITGSAVKISSASGSVRVAGSINCDDLDVSSMSGSVNINSAFAADGVVLKSRTGSIDSLEVRAINITIESASGSQASGLLKADENIRLTATSGRIKADTASSKQHYIRTTSGSIRIGELSGTGDVESSSGTIRTG